MTQLRYLMDKYLKECFEGTAHPLRKATLNDFVTWVENRETSKVLTEYLNGKLKGTDLEGKAQVTVQK